jgi:hypothetical protein
VQLLSGKHGPSSVVLRSQPLLTSPSQLAQPAAHVPIAHVRELQSPLALGGKQGVPQLPQLLSVASDSQPFMALPSQLSKLVLQPVSWHAPVEQLDMPFGREQVTPHAPQFMFVRIETSQPSPSWLLQSRKPELQVKLQPPPVQVAELTFSSSSQS